MATNPRAPVRVMVRHLVYATGGTAALAQRNLADGVDCNDTFTGGGHVALDEHAGCFDFVSLRNRIYEEDAKLSRYLELSQESTKAKMDRNRRECERLRADPDNAYADILDDAEEYDESDAQEERDHYSDMVERADQVVNLLNHLRFGLRESGDAFIAFRYD
jgi:hypothetical protein